MPTVFTTNQNSRSTKKKSAEKNSFPGEHLFISHITIYQSGVILAMYLVVLELLFVLLSSVVRVLLGFLVPSLGADTIYTLNTVLYAILIIIKLIFMITIIFQWLENYYEIRPGKVIHKSGVFKHNEEAFDCPDIAKVELNQGFWARLLHFGTITLITTINKDSFSLNNIPNPHRNLKIIEHSINSKQLDITLTEDLLDE
jgi:membrane protein YdbS with pleckstrin-like domain